jgi:hypothetical protein
MFAAIRGVSFNAQLGPFETFAELQAAGSRELPGSLFIPAASANVAQGLCRAADGSPLGTWHGPPFSMSYPVALRSYIGEFDSLDELQVAVAHVIAGAVMVPPNKKLFGSEHRGDIMDASGHVAAHWIEVAK